MFRKPYIKVFRDRQKLREAFEAWRAGVSIADLSRIHNVHRKSIYHHLQKEILFEKTTYQYIKKNQKKIIHVKHEIVGTMPKDRINQGKDSYQEYLNEENRKRLQRFIPCEKLIMILPPEELPRRCLIK